MNQCTLDASLDFDFFQQKMTASDRFTMKRYFNFKTKAVFTFYFTSDQCLQSECLSDFVWMKTLNWTENHKEIEVEVWRFLTGIYEFHVKKSCRNYGGSTADDWSTKLQKKECGAKYTFKFEEAEGILAIY